VQDLPVVGGQAPQPRLAANTDKSLLHDVNEHNAPQLAGELDGVGRTNFRHLHDWLAEIGGADRDRTGDLKLAKLALSQLSYGPSWAGSSGSAIREAATDAAVQSLNPDPGGPGKS
jgi:hypothetical protein